MGIRALFATLLIVGCSAAPTTVTSSSDADTPSPLVKTLQTYHAIVSEMDELRRVQKTTYDDYKVDRFGDSDIQVPPENIAGMPDLTSLSAADRFAMNESELLQLHRSNLQAFKGFMYFLRLDERQSNSPADFGANFSTISGRLARVVAMIESVIEYQGYFQDGLPTPPTVVLAPNDCELVRNIRDLYVLQELYAYLSVAYYDLYNWYSRHLYDLTSQ